MRSHLLVLLVGAGACAANDRPAPRVEFAAPPGSGEPHLAATGDGRAVLTWLEPAGTGERRHALRLAVRDAGAWSEPRTIIDSDSLFVNWADFPALVALPNGAWIAHWLARVPGGTYAYHVRLAVSRDQGRTWSRPLTPHRDRTPQEHGFVSFIALDDSTAALVWLDGRAMQPPRGDEHDATGDMTLRFTTVTAGGRLGDEVLLDPRTCECCQTAMTRAASGPVVAYRDRSAGEIRDIAVVRRVAGTWTEPARVAADEWHYPGCPVNGPQLDARGDTVAIAWFTAPEGAARVQLAFSTDGGATWSAPQRVDDGRPQGRVDVTLLGGRAALVTWIEGTSEIRARRVTADGDASDSWTVSETSQGRSGGFPRIVRLGDEMLYAWTGGDGVRVAAQRLQE